jgi:hypothetical protein
LAFFDRTTGQAAPVVVDNLKPATVVPVTEKNIAEKARVVTDEAGHYSISPREFAEHTVVRHCQEDTSSP